MHGLLNFRKFSFFKEWILENTSPEFLTTLVFALVLLAIIIIPQILLVKEGQGGTAEQQFEEVRRQQRHKSHLRQRKVTTGLR